MKAHNDMQKQTSSSLRSEQSEYHTKSTFNAPRERRPNRTLASWDVSDEELMRLAASGDQQAFTKLVDRHLGRIVGLATKFLGSRNDAEEIAQEAFIRVWRFAPRWLPAEDFGDARFNTWLYRIVVNLIIDHKRRNQPYQLSDLSEILDYSSDSFDKLYGRELSSAISQSISRLPRRQKMALTLCFFNGVSNFEAAKIMSLTVGAVESLLVRARRTVRSDLNGLYLEVLTKR